MKKLIIEDKFTLTGRGLVFLVSMQKNDLDNVSEGEEFEVEDKVWIVESIGGVRSDREDMTIVGLLVKPKDAQV